MTRIPLSVATLTCVLALSGAEAGAEPGPPESSATKPVTKLTLKRSPYGRVLFANGYAMYSFTRDTAAESECYGPCAEAWPPLQADGRVIARRGARRRLLGTTTRADGSKQVTYAGHPLYGYVHDPRGEVYCQDVFEYGGIWYAVRRSGHPASSG